MGYAKTLSAEQIQLLMLDEGKLPLSEAHRHDLMEIMDAICAIDRSAQVPIWYNCMTTPWLTQPGTG